jgi:RHS repeat-associated protein
VNMAQPSDVWLDATYDAWGSVKSYKLDGVDQGANLANWPIPHGFAGGLLDSDTGLVRFGARDYDPVIGRWTVRDPILFEGGQANLYVYVNNSPSSVTDPKGLWLVAGGWSGGAAFSVGGDVGFGIYVSDAGFGVYGTVDGVMGLGPYAGHGASLTVADSLDAFRGYSEGGKVEGPGFEVGVWQNDSGKGITLSGGPQLGVFAGRTDSYTWTVSISDAVSNAFNNAVESFRRDLGCPR